MNIHINQRPPVASKVLDTYWKFAAARQDIFFARLAGKAQLTTDPILLKHKFTNAYRAADRVSQYLIKEVIYTGDQRPEELLFRIILFKLFNKIETWQLFEQEFGQVTWRDFSLERYAQVLDEAIRAGGPIYSGAYLMTSGTSAYGHTRKHENHLELIEHMMRSRLAEQVQHAVSLEAVYQLLLSYPTIGKFLAYQYAIDINYSTLTDFSEMDFVMPGPGARDGIRKCFSELGGYTEADIIRYVTDRQEQEFERLDIEFKTLWGRPLQLIDCQNLFCETDKYARVAHPEISGISGRTKIKQVYCRIDHDINYFFPPKWGLNERLNSLL
ncbi:hypothetical protein LLH06_10940 [Mucilaginibacter daejeonensis]|uniref:nucleotide kinase domain-containing protein n=1 Tax=Mucilaginibacter daejeonensis TaxID=398049 RepID=UPI001D17D024|nr:nucleotide kinase domain-containing protein [Mucilaginibacter daejeonensis]UEG51489.1 hypothetical protein LLH06_10940 [Mucilaginibacter daejeonensis]